MSPRVRGKLMLLEDDNRTVRGNPLTDGSSPDDIVTVIRLVPLGGPERTESESAIVATFAKACVRTEGDSIFLVTRNESELRIKVGDIVHWVGEPFGIVWRTERRAGEAGVGG